MITKVHFERQILLGLLLALIAAFLWPLGNRKILIKLEEKGLHLNAMQRVLGMTVGSVPILIILAFYGYVHSGMPANNQIVSSFLAVVFSGILGSTIFFKALSMVRNDAIAMASVEGMQVTVVLFTLLGEMIFNGIHWPGIYADWGMAGITIGIIMYVWLSQDTSRRKLVSLQSSENDK